MTYPNKILTVPYGHPPKEDNEVLNPGRKQIGPSSTMGYYDSVADPWTLVLVDVLMAETPEDDDTRVVPTNITTGGDPNSTSASTYPMQNTGIPNEEGYSVPVRRPRGALNSEPEYDEGWMINRKSTWHSGPPVNDWKEDNAIPGAGYWTQKGSPTASGTGDKDKQTGLQIFTSSDRPVLLFNTGHGNIASEGGSPGSNVIGWDGYLYADKQSNALSKAETSIGICHAWAMYSCDLTIGEKIDLVKALINWVMENFPEEIPDQGFANFEGPIDPVIKAKVYDQISTASISVKLLIRIIKAIIKIIEQAQDESVVGGMVVNWDFLGKLTIPTTANEYIYTPDAYGTGGNGSYSWGPYSGSWPARRFSYVIEPEVQAFMGILKLRINGILWHISAPSGGLRYRIMRTYDFAHIYSPSITTSIDDRICRRYAQVFPQYSERRNPHAWYDDTFYVDTGKWDGD